MGFRSVGWAIGAAAWFASLIAVGFWQYEQGIDSERVIRARLEASAAKALAAETEKVRQQEQRARRLTDALDQSHAQHVKEATALRRDNQRLAAAVRMRDPGARAADCPAAVSANNPAAVPTGSSPAAELSAEATEFLLDFAFDADIAARYASSCREWALNTEGR